MGEGVPVGAEAGAFAIDPLGFKDGIGVTLRVGNKLGKVSYNSEAVSERASVLGHFDEGICDGWRLD